LKDVAVKGKSRVLGIEIAMDNFVAAKSKMADMVDVQIIHGDIWKYNIDEQFNVIIFSNTLEHLDRRAQLLKLLVTNLNPKRILIRVPMFEREWPVPYKKELGIEWRLDPTHEIEYTQKELKEEIFEAGLDIFSLDSRWGEFYVVAVPKK
jgi:SAM-dependent methyltransferase